MSRDPRSDPQPGDLFRDRFEPFPRKVLRREADRLLIEIGGRRGWTRLTKWQEWAGQKHIVMVRAVANQEA